jgi:hypothetical protein
MKPLKAPLLKAKCIDAENCSSITKGNTYYVREDKYNEFYYEVYRNEDETSFVSIYSKNRFKLIEDEPLIKVKCTTGIFVYLERDQIYLAENASSNLYRIYDLDKKDLSTYSKKYFTIVGEETEIEILTRKLKESEEIANNLKKELDLAKLKEKHPNNPLIGLDICELNSCIDGNKLSNLIGGLDTFKVRSGGEYANLGFYLTSTYSWELVTDSIGTQILVPTKKD